MDWTEEQDCATCEGRYRRNYESETCPRCRANAYFHRAWMAEGRVEALEAIVDHVATDGSQITPELQAAARKLLEEK